MEIKLYVFYQTYAYDVARTHWDPSQLHGLLKNEIYNICHHIGKLLNNILFFPRVKDAVKNDGIYAWNISGIWICRLINLFYKINYVTSCIHMTDRSF